MTQVKGPSLSAVRRAAQAARTRRGRVHVLDEPRAMRRIGVGLAGMLLVHLGVGLALWWLPEGFWGETSRTWSSPTDVNARSFEIELASDILRPLPAEPPPGRFVEINPAAPENPPDETELFGKQNQQVAQPKPTLAGESHTPSVDGEGEDNTSAIVSGSLVQEEATPAVSELLSELFEVPQGSAAAGERDAPETSETDVRAQAAMNAPVGGEHLIGEADGDVGSTVTRVPPTPGAEAGPEARAGEASPSAPGAPRRGSGYFGGTVGIDPLRPRERPRLAAAQVQARTTPTIKNEFGTRTIGALAYDAKWSAYGEYLQRLIEAVQIQWERLLLRSDFYPTSGSLVKVVFKLDAVGAVTEIVALEGSGGEMARRLCVSAITERAPYGEWSEDMIAVLGREQELTFTFHYQ